MFSSIGTFPVGYLHLYSTTDSVETVVPECRTILIVLGSRTIDIGVEDRIIAIGVEDRIVLLGSENREIKANEC